MRAPNISWAQSRALIETLGWHVRQPYSQNKWCPFFRNLRWNLRSAESLNVRLALRRPTIVTIHAQFKTSFGPTFYLTVQNLNFWTSPMHNLSPNFSAAPNSALYVTYRAQFVSTRDYVSFAQFGAEFEPNLGQSPIPPCLRCGDGAGRGGVAEGA